MFPSWISEAVMHASLATARILNQVARAGTPGVDGDGRQVISLRASLSELQHACRLASRSSVVSGSRAAVKAGWLSVFLDFERPNKAPATYTIPMFISGTKSVPQNYALEASSGTEIVPLDMSSGTKSVPLESPAEAARAIVAELEAEPMAVSSGTKSVPLKKRRPLFSPHPLSPPYPRTPLPHDDDDEIHTHLRKQEERGCWERETAALELDLENVFGFLDAARFVAVHGRERVQAAVDKVRAMDLHDGAMKNRGALVRRLVEREANPRPHGLKQ